MGNRSLSNNEFIKKAKEIHGDKYDYSNVHYVNSKVKVCIICPIHGEFWQTPNDHLNGSGCLKCGIENKKSCNAKFIEKAGKIHKEKGYNYSKVDYKDNHTKVCLICPEHGEFWQIPHNHLQGHGCPKCAKVQISLKMSSNTEEFIKKAKEKHGDRYDYSKVDYKGNQTKVCIICPVHGEFWQRPNDHLRGSGCSKCNNSHLEKETEILLKKYKINYEVQRRFDWLIGYKGGKMSLDFYLFENRIAIECQGIQHYNENGYFTQDKIKEIKQRDALKRQLCEEHGIKMFYISYNENVEQKINELINKLK